MKPYSLYLHIPFCRHRCGYCDFNTYAGLEAAIPDYVSALCAEIEGLSAAAGEHLPAAGGHLPAHTVFFGGGTPSLLPAAELGRVLQALRAAFDLLPGAEISLEANPGTLSLAYLRDLRSLGINRLSLGVQSANPSELRLLERIHDYPDVIRTVTWARQAGFDNLNLDLIFGLPEQELSAWQRTLGLALGLHPEHFSLYALSLEHGTPFGRWAGRGLLSIPDPDRAADMYDWATEQLEAHGYGQYEISNWAQRLPGSEENELRSCRHNLQYWRNLPYLGLGAGAHGYAGGVRTANVLAPGAYIQRLLVDRVDWPAFPRTPANQTVTEIDREAEIAETMMMGLRLTQEGVSQRAFTERFGMTLEERFGQKIEKLRRQGLLEWEGERLRLTQKARLVGNRVFVEFV